MRREEMKMKRNEIKMKRKWKMQFASLFLNVNCTSTYIQNLCFSLYILVGSLTRMAARTLEDAVWIGSWQVISLRISDVIASRFKTGCAPEVLLGIWLCSEFMTFKLYDSISPSSSTFTMGRKGHSICLLVLWVCDAFVGLGEFAFFFRDHIWSRVFFEDLLWFFWYEVRSQRSLRDLHVRWLDEKVIWV